MGIGPIDSKEATQIWRSIEKEKKNLYDLINNYHRIKENKLKPKFMELVESLSFPLNKKGGVLFNSLGKKEVIRINAKDKKFKDDPLVKSLDLEEFLIVSLWTKGKPAGAVVTDNYITKKPISDEDIKSFTMFMEQARGALENSQSFESTLTQAHTDPLTSLWNYGYFQYRLDEEINKADATCLPLSLMMIDIDDFKKFNDSCGHIQGDKALKKISEVFKENCRKIDILCRYGGEEFSLILPANNKKEAALLGERIRKSLEDKKILKNRFTVSIGIASYPKDSSNKKALIEKADQALYKAKRKGKNRVILI
jgi:diguanylate cyclase (GGDEF)-like protein